MIKILQKVLELKKFRGGIPQFLYVDVIHPGTTYEVRSAIIDFKKANPTCEEIDFIINSPGGSADDAYRIITSLRKNFKTVNIIVPFWAKSAATLLSLGGSTIIMSEFGELGPLDVQLGKERDDSPEFERESALNDDQTVTILETHFKIMYESMFIRIYEHKKINISKNELSRQLLENISKFYEPMLRQIDPYKLGDKRRKLDIASEYAKRILSQFRLLKDVDKIRKLIYFLVDGCPDHGYVIDFELMSQLLPNCYTGKHFSSQYQDALNQLSLMFIANEDEDEEHIGFVEEKDWKVENNDEDIQSELLGIEIEDKTESIESEETETKINVDGNDVTTENDSTFVNHNDNNYETDPEKYDDPEEQTTK